MSGLAVVDLPEAEELRAIVMFDVNDDAKHEYRRVEVLTGPGRRRRWSADEKARIVEETLAPGGHRQLEQLGLAMTCVCGTGSRAITPRR